LKKGVFFFLRPPPPAHTRLGVYTVINAGWSSDSGYSLLGGLCALAQTISYEVRLAQTILLSFVVLVCRNNLAYFYFFLVYLWLIFLSLPLLFIYFLFG
jgi:NADH-ubiquinone oxidoreductase chain 1